MEKLWHVFPTSSCLRVGAHNRLGRNSKSSVCADCGSRRKITLDTNYINGLLLCSTEDRVAESSRLGEGSMAFCLCTNHVLEIALHIGGCRNDQATTKCAQSTMESYTEKNENICKNQGPKIFISHVH